MAHPPPPLSLTLSRCLFPQPPSPHPFFLFPRPLTHPQSTSVAVGVLDELPALGSAELQLREHRQRAARIRPAPPGPGSALSGGRSPAKPHPPVYLPSLCPHTHTRAHAQDTQSRVPPVRCSVASTPHAWCVRVVGVQRWAARQHWTPDLRWGHPSLCPPLRTSEAALPAGQRRPAQTRVPACTHLCVHPHPRTPSMTLLQHFPEQICDTRTARGS